MPDYLNESFDLSDQDIVSVFDELPLWSSYFGADLLDLINYRTEISALDIGCGAGFPLIEIAQRLGPDSKVYGVDVWEAALIRLNHKISVMKIKNVSLVNHSAEELPFEDEKFDLVVSNNGINNVSDPGKVIDECYRTMKSDAQFIISVNLPGTMQQFYDVFKDVLRQSGLSNKINEVEKHISSKRKTAAEYLKMLKDRKFMIDEVKENSFVMRYADGTAFLNHFFIKLAFLDSWKNIIAPDKLNEVFSNTESQLNIAAADTGHLKMEIPFIVISCFK